MDPPSLVGVEVEVEVYTLVGVEIRMVFSSLVGVKQLLNKLP